MGDKKPEAVGAGGSKCMHSNGHSEIQSGCLTNLSLKSARIKGKKRFSKRLPSKIERWPSVTEKKRVTKGNQKLATSTAHTQTEHGRNRMTDIPLG